MSKKCNTCNRVYNNPDDFLIETSRWRLGPKEMLFFNCSCLSTLAIPKDKFPFYSNSINFNEQQKSVFNSLSLDKALPTISPNLYQVQFELNKDEPDLKLVAKLIRNEPATAASLLQLASLRTRDHLLIKTIEHAVAYIGKKELSELIILADLKKLKISCTIFSIDQFWKDSITAGRIAELIANKSFNKELADMAYLCACLADIGKLVIGLYNPKVLDKIEKKIKENHAPWIPNELELNVNHITMGEIAGAFWAFPDEVLDSIQHHHSHNMNRNLNGIVSLAIQLTHLANGEKHLIDTNILELGLSIFKIDEKEIFNSLVEQTNNLSQKAS